MVESVLVRLIFYQDYKLAIEDVLHLKQSAWGHGEGEKVVSGGKNHSFDKNKRNYIERIIVGIEKIKFLLFKATSVKNYDLWKNMFHDCENTSKQTSSSVSDLITKNKIMI